MSDPPLRPRPASGALGGPFVHLDLTTSTNDHARALALAGAPAGTVVAAEEQTAGRGRQGRAWSSPRGRSLTLSALLRPAANATSLLPLAAALAVCEACESVTEVECAIKWPNDVLLEGRKLAGILIESRPQDGWAVLGIGLNVNTGEAELEPRVRETATSLLIATGLPVDRERVLDALLDSLAARTAPEMLRSPELLSAYRRRDALEGRRIAWTARGRRLEGKAAGIDELGSLVVFGVGGERVVLDAGEVHLLESSL
jgi:BirA family biotin operon repressor/biotin-[acetyl-CoA-carboxylase] ligase